MRREAVRKLTKLIPTEIKVVEIKFGHMRTHVQHVRYCFVTIDSAINILVPYKLTKSSHSLRLKPASHLVCSALFYP